LDRATTERIYHYYSAEQVEAILEDLPNIDDVIVTKTDLTTPNIEGVVH
jgi:hypothetical protein